MRESNHRTHPLSLRVEIRVSHESANEGGYFSLTNHCDDEAVTRMPKLPPIETHVACKECNGTLTEHEGDNFLVL